MGATRGSYGRDERIKRQQEELAYLGDKFKLVRAERQRRAKERGRDRLKRYYERVKQWSGRSSGAVSGKSEAVPDLRGCEAREIRRHPLNDCVRGRDATRATPLMLPIVWR